MRYESSNRYNYLRYLQHRQSHRWTPLHSIYFMIGSMLNYLPYTLEYINFSSTSNITFTCMVKARSLAISTLVTYENLLILIKCIIIQNCTFGKVQLSGSRFLHYHSVYSPRRWMAQSVRVFDSLAEG